jgi:hypothetical protein
MERQVLGGLILPPGSGPAEKTVDRIAARIGLSTTDVSKTLRQLESLDPALVHRDTDAKLQIEFWIALEAAISSLEGAEGGS